ncbi:glutamine synthetase beta-grasp domain-containing protein [Microbulbifer sp. TRSA001]|uniref:glutamine synthetase beta-grasp domain-containing protein n=1 Tax=unclassified Microbulbifer TaxID=2619833 RepID=UPI0024AE768B|nr:glutamine synthetase beta-grasp domain-containing protein [Microbulbifer sp. VAAF005]WHI46050.1 glutamine synthetase beta-grasp domain-containing protein [Microbulbifer sp. VAAF005]
MSKLSFVEYLWIDEAGPMQQIRSKARALSLPDCPVVTDFPLWTFDRSKTEQLDDSDSDCFLNPIRVYRDPLRGLNDYIVLCEVLEEGKKIHLSNIRARIRKTLDCLERIIEPQLGFEQEYKLISDCYPFRFSGVEAFLLQRVYYCGVGSESVYGRKVAEAHAKACIDAGILISEIKTITLGQWVFRIGYRGIDGECCDALTIADDVWVARYLLNRVCERFMVRVFFSSKYLDDSWKGPCIRTKFSTAITRDPDKGQKALMNIVNALNGKFNVEHDDELIREARPVVRQGCVYLEGLHSGVNTDPYHIGYNLIASTIDDVDDADALRSLREAGLLLTKSHRDTEGSANTLRDRSGHTIPAKSEGVTRE